MVGPLDELALKWDHDRALSLHGFTRGDCIPRYLLLGTIDVLVPSQDPKANPEGAARALSALVRAMAVERVVALARYVKRKGSAPAWGMLVPALAAAADGTGGDVEPGGGGGGGGLAGEEDEGEDPTAAAAAGSQAVAAAAAPSSSSASSSASARGSAYSRLNVDALVASGAYVAHAPDGLPDCLLFAPLPFEDDLRRFPFRDFSADPRFAPEPKLLAAVDGLIDGLNLMNAGPVRARGESGRACELCA